jgi:5-methylcytosine-specific restriction endonuclease McrA
VRGSMRSSTRCSRCDASRVVGRQDGRACECLCMFPEWLQPEWRGRYGGDGHWVSEWPAGICKECGVQFQGDPSRRYCSPACKKRAHTRSGNHAGRTRKRVRKHGGVHSAYEIIGKFELHDAFQGLCAICGDPIDASEAWLGHKVSVSEGGQHTRGNIAPVHKGCEEAWTRGV